MIDDNEVLEQSTNEQVQEVPKQVEEPKKENDPDRNFRLLREKAERAERERDEAVRYAKHLEESKVSPQQSHEPDLDIDIESDAIAEGKHIKQVSQRMKNIEQQLKNYHTQTKQEFINAQLKSQYPDIEQVVTQENIKTLKDVEPELAAAISSSTDYYNMAVSAYKTIKRAGIYQDKQTTEIDKNRALANLNKPRPLTSISPQQGDSPMSQANAFASGLTPELKKKLMDEMIEARRNY